MLTYMSLYFLCISDKQTHKVWKKKILDIRSYRLLEAVLKIKYEH